jgi:ubiquinol-cytochrome c reductase cytochrome c1 subunit
MRRLVPALAAAALLGALSIAASLAPSLARAEEAALPEVHWSFEGVFGTFDRAAARRGFQVYKEVCSVCHSMNLLHYRNLEALGFSQDEVKAIAASFQVPGEPDDNGDVKDRPAKPSDAFKAPFPNPQAARAANNGALPPDLSVITKARKGGATYVHAILMGYGEPPADLKMADGMNYNKYFTGHQIAMPAPLQDNSVTYADGTAAPLDREATDVATFLAWAAEPELEERHFIGIKTILFLIVLSALLYAVKRKVWAKVH